MDCAVHGPFVCRANFSLDSYQSLFGELALLERELIRTLAIEKAQIPIEVYLFSDRATYETYLRQLYPSVPYRRALFVRSGNLGRVFAYRADALPVDLRHECTHALMHASQPMVPLWLDEGLAEYFEVPEHQRAFDSPHLASLRWNMRFGMIPSLRMLEAKSDLSEMGGLEYRFSWAWAHFMLHGPVDAHRELVYFLADARRGKPPGLLSSRLALAVPDLQMRFVQHFKYWKQA
ncbi:MAG: hypothetical protein JW829_19650 [Pirellulales bacterium]|nr:hypothetical protein [Pirellulales bacterium]